MHGFLWRIFNKMSDAPYGFDEDGHITFCSSVNAFYSTFFLLMMLFLEGGFLYGRGDFLRQF